MGVIGVEGVGVGAVSSPDAAGVAPVFAPFAFAGFYNQYQHCLEHDIRSAQRYLIILSDLLLRIGLVCLLRSWRCSGLRWRRFRPRLFSSWRCGRWWHRVPSLRIAHWTTHLLGALHHCLRSSWTPPGAVLHAILHGAIPHLLHLLWRQLLRVEVSRMRTRRRSHHGILRHLSVSRELWRHSRRHLAGVKGHTRRR